ncbi:MAG: hypothetical protein DMF03_03435 [Verrucomicrobia bacterium]|nr:MAG: hypothetical protein DMF03_03435 [Verrucomicrobiota bacterium]
MKPRSQISSVSHVFDLGDRFTARRARKFPGIECHFQEPRQTNGGSSGKPDNFSTDGFHRLSSRYITKETSRAFVADAIIFGMIVGVSAWPIISMIQALVHLFR